MPAAFAAAGALLFVYWEALCSYLRDQHYQEHFLYLWCFLGIALTRTLRRPYRGRFASSLRRDRWALVSIGAAWLLLAASELVGSSTAARASLAVFLTGVALLVIPAWTAKRCLLHGLVLLLCFGIPYSVYLPATDRLQWGVASAIALPARLGLVNYVVDGSVVQFPDYQLRITPDCSGLGQLLTFLGIAALGVLSAAPNRRRTVRLVALAVVLAWLSNLARVAFFVLLSGIGWRRAVEDGVLHALLGFAIFFPFVLLLIGSILRTHVAFVAATDAAAPGRWPVLVLVVPMLAIRLLLPSGGAVEFPAPAYFARLDAPPGHRIEMRSPTEGADRSAYVTPWLVNARFQDEAGRSFDLMHYATRSNSHLCVHKVALCLREPDQRVHYEAAVRVDGRAWWRLALDADDPAKSVHAYFAFEIGGQRYDDSFVTQLEVVRQRLFGGTWEVRCSRLVFQGPLPEQPTLYEASVLTWLGRLTAQ